MLSLNFVEMPEVKLQSLLCIYFLSDWQDFSLCYSVIVGTTVNDPPTCGVFVYSKYRLKSMHYDLSGIYDTFSLFV